MHFAPPQYKVQVNASSSLHQMARLACAGTFFIISQLDPLRCCGEAAGKGYVQELRQRSYVCLWKLVPILTKVVESLHFSIQSQDIRWLSPNNIGYGRSLAPKVVKRNISAIIIFEGCLETHDAVEKTASFTVYIPTGETLF